MDKLRFYVNHIESKEIEIEERLCICTQHIEGARLYEAGHNRIREVEDRLVAMTKWDENKILDKKLAMQEAQQDALMAKVKLAKIKKQMAKSKEEKRSLQ